MRLEPDLNQFPRLIRTGGEVPIPYSVLSGLNTGFPPAGSTNLTEPLGAIVARSFITPEIRYNMTLRTCREASEPCAGDALAAMVSSTD